ncbi:chloride channel protein [Streptomyces sp. NPDC085540]|uniref:chloride channel protein n=1 Tax=Streptomyces sp. NPDC085540 TaxID=3365730 RepID=UPI0037D3C114
MRDRPAGTARRAGSGIQHVEAVWRQEVEARTARLLPANFLGGLSAIGSGLALGREGPIVQMGAAIRSAAGRRGRLDVQGAQGAEDTRMPHTALGGAGLTVASPPRWAGRCSSVRDDGRRADGLDPLLTGGGDHLRERLLAGGSLTAAALVLCLAVRFEAGPLGYAAAAPGGPSAPLPPLPPLPPQPVALRRDRQP